mmetsp:Transcript_15230/g.22613  ORF Transcript_15230/g.22613 Transcript_15230/m.22613 type:complete len:98 (-) Transcript_15230:264-557(-)
MAGNESSQFGRSKVCCSSISNPMTKYDNNVAAIMMAMKLETDKCSSKRPVISHLFFGNRKNKSSTCTSAFSRPTEKVVKFQQIATYRDSTLCLSFHI